MVCKVIHSAIKPVGKPQVEDCSPSRKSPLSHLERQDSAPEGKCSPSLKSICLIRQHRVCPYLKNCLRTSNRPPLCHLHIYNVRARGRRAGGKPATAVPTRFVLEKKSACPAPEYVFGKAQRAFTSTSEMFCERQKNCFWHSKQTKEERGKTSCRGFYFPFSRICSNPCAASKNVWRVARANCRWKWRFTGTLR